MALCGEPEDAAVFDELVIRAREDPTFDLGLDAAIACYLTLGGESALAGIEAEYLANPQADYTATQSAIMAVRVHGEEMERFCARDWPQRCERCWTARIWRTW